jgi:hypothetical protein
MSLVDHKRQRCAKTYHTLEPKNYNNQQCILLHAKNSGELPEADRTFNDLTWLENSAELLGVNHECLIIDKTHENFAYTDKIPAYYEYLCNTDYEYALIADSTDSAIIANPDDGISLLEEYDCEVLYSTTHWWDYDAFTMPAQYKFNFERWGTTYINTGVCIGKTDTLRRLFKRVLDYAAFEPATYYAKTYRDTNGYVNWSPERLAAFPKGCSDDQTIIRYLVKEFWPAVKVDYKFKLAVER